MRRKMEIQAPAKINLSLQVVGKRADGYHDLRTLMCCVGLYDTLELSLGGGRNLIVCSQAGVPCDQSNLALKAGLRFNQILANQTHIDPPSICVHLTKRIPVGAGMGGGSSDAAAVLNALNHHHGYPLSRSRLLALALELGADVPFFIDGRPALARGVGERLEPCPSLPSWKVVVVYPGFGISTAEVFKNLKLGLTRCEKPLTYLPFKYGKFDIERHLFNDLEQVVANQFPIIQEIKKGLLNQGAKGASMTGSGSAVFGLFADAATAERAAAVLARRDQWRVYATELLA